jgi:pyruvate dehydrogenase E2 component (dihydrolipoamide acetyltransferase)
MDVESPYEGVLTEWLAKPDDILPIGAEVARMEVTEAVEEAPSHLGHVEATAAPEELTPGGTSTAPRNAGIPPRTRAYAKEKGLSDEELAGVSAAGSKLMPTDIDAFLASRDIGAPAGVSSTDRSGGATGAEYKEAALPQKQRLLASRLLRGTQLVVPGTITVAASWEAVEGLRARIKASGDPFQPSAFTMVAYAVAQTLTEFPLFRSSLVGDDRVRTYRHVHLGIAVALPGDELALAVVEDADTLPWREFATRARERIEMARGGQDQASEAVSLSLTNMQAFGLRDAVPVVVPPSVGTLFLGEVYNAFDPESDQPKIRRTCNLALTFDHRLINGVGAAQFLNAIKTKVETIGAVIVG